MSYLIHAAKIIWLNRIVTNAYLEVASTGKFGKLFKQKPQTEQPTLDLGNMLVAPGLVDTHIHGLLNEDVMKSDWRGIDKISQGLLKAGVTSWLPTTITAPACQLLRICEMFGRRRGEERGARIQGLHFEGPFFSAKYAGAENPRYMTDPDWQQFKQWRAASSGLLNKISLAPERKGSTAFIKKAEAAGVVVSLGHTASDYQTALKAVRAGASMFTHSFNGMPELRHRNPTIANAALTLDRTYSEIICDGHHVDLSLVKALYKTKGSGQVILVTDCMQAGGMPDGDYYLGELPVYVKDGMARLKAENNLAGSILLLKDAVKNLVDWQIAPPLVAIKMASWTAAKSARIADKCGVIKEGRNADFTVWDGQMNLKFTYLGGHKVFKA